MLDDRNTDQRRSEPSADAEHDRPATDDRDAMSFRDHDAYPTARRSVRRRAAEEIERTVPSERDVDELARLRRRR